MAKSPLLGGSCQVTATEVPDTCAATYTGGVAGTAGSGGAELDAVTLTSVAFTGR